MGKKDKNKMIKTKENFLSTDDVIRKAYNNYVEQSLKYGVKPMSFEDFKKACKIENEWP
ncbi:hypothetical protein JXR93_02915 [bacterium]|nr:hypothetical protein [bacterium]